VLDEHRQPAAAVEVRMADHDGIDGLHIDRQRLPVALAVQLQALEQAAVEQEARTTDLDQMLRAGDAVGGAEAGSASCFA
jgi:hypothetical protein